MNKKEQAEFDRLRDELRLAKALRWTTPIKPDIPIPSSYSNGLNKGFLYNAYLGGYGGPRVEKACSSNIYHNFGDDDKTTTQGGRALYSSRLLALKALRADVEKQCAEILANIDKQIGAEL